MLRYVTKYIQKPSNLKKLTCTCISKILHLGTSNEQLKYINVIVRGVLPVDDYSRSKYWWKDRQIYCWRSRGYTNSTNWYIRKVYHLVGDYLSLIYWWKDKQIGCRTSHVFETTFWHLYDGRELSHFILETFNVVLSNKV